MDFLKVLRELPYDPAIPLLGMWPHVNSNIIYNGQDMEIT